MAPPSFASLPERAALLVAMVSWLVGKYSNAHSAREREVNSEATLVLHRGLLRTAASSAARSAVHAGTQGQGEMPTGTRQGCAATANACGHSAQMATHNKAMGIARALCSSPPVEPIRSRFDQEANDSINDFFN